MSFFEVKTLKAEVRGRWLEFEVISQKDLNKLKYYGKITPDMIKEMDSEEVDDLRNQSSREINELLASKVVGKEGEDSPTADDFEDLMSSEIEGLLGQLTGTAKAKKQKR